jgi:uncharacterized protein DUF2490
MTYVVGALLIVVALVCQTLAGVAHAADSSEFWPEVSGFVALSPRTRIFLNAAYAEAKESDDKSLDLAAYLDISLKPILRKELLAQDWQRSRYFWARIGYDRVFKATDGADAEVAEDRGILALYAKAPLPADVWLEARVRADLRWIGDDYSTRYRFRVEATREFTVLNHTVVPYFNVEWFYDTRYDGWARTLYQLGPEVTVNKHFRFEVYIARQEDRLPSASSTNAFGVVAKWYY